MEGNSTGHKPDPDSTDRLPALTPDKILSIESSRQPGRANDRPGQSATIPPALFETIREGTVRTKQLATRVAAQERTIAELKQVVEAVSDQTIVELAQTVEAVSERQSKTESALAKSERAVADARLQAETAKELVGKVQVAMRALHQRIESLETYIAGRPEGWKEMEQALHSKSVRIAEAEAQLAEKIALLAEDLSWPESEDPDLPETASGEPSTAETDAAESDNESTKLQPVLELPDSQPETEPEPATESEPADVTLLEPVRPEPGDAQRSPDRIRIPALVGLTPNAPVACAIENESIILGRDPDCDITIPAHSVSRKHAVVLRDGADVVIEDRASTNGVFVNALRVARAVLADGDEISIGDSRFRFVGGELRD